MNHQYHRVSHNGKSITSDGIPAVPNYRLIVTLRNALPLLLAEIERLAGERDAYKMKADEWDAFIHAYNCLENKPEIGKLP